MSYSTAFEITEQDVENVLRANWAAVADSKGQSFAQMADNIFANISSVQHERVGRAALDAGCEMDEQTTAAYAEIRTIMVEDGVLKW